MTTNSPQFNIEKFLILRPLLQKISSGNFFIAVGAWYLRTIASLSVVGLIYFSWNLWRLPERFSFEIFVSFFIVQIALIAITYFGVNVLWVRAEDILKQPTETDYTATHVVAVLIKATGEVAAVTYLTLGVASAIFIWMMGTNLPLMEAIGLPARSGFVGGLLAILIGFIIAAVALFFSYVTAELFVAIVDIARNTKKR
ncbi:MAG: hypothetical protein NZL89_02000 [Leptospiraceae bacterium]|nr:hypothetical protein [Leptospiraceae bacterium]